MIRTNFVTARSPRQEAYQHYIRHSLRWRIVRGVRCWLDGYRCRTCHATTATECHHASYQDVQMYPGAWLNLWSVWCEVMDTTLLCDTCHSAVHRGRSIAEFAD